MRGVILVLADGLRPDAITPSRMPSLDGLAGAARFSGEHRPAVVTA